MSEPAVDAPFPAAGVASTLSPLGRRIVVVGLTGSGKSTLAQRLAAGLELSFIDLDALFWLPHWTESDPARFRALVDGATGGDDWVVAGNYGSQVAPIIWCRAETVVWLDYPLRLCLRRLVARSWTRWRSRELLWGTNHETFWRHLFTRDSLFLWALRSHGKLRRRYTAAISDPQWAHLTFVRLRSPGETEPWLRQTFASGEVLRPGAS